MGAGTSAEREGERARAAERRLEKKARNARRAADSWDRGAEGERLTAEALSPLERKGWNVLHDRRAPDGGNVDHIVVGPPGIAVLDSKNWSNPVTITPDRRLVFSKHDKTGELDRLGRIVEEIRALVASDGVKVAVRGYLVLTGAEDRGRESSDLGDLRVLGVECLAARLAGAKPDLDPALVAAVTETLETRLLPMTDTEPDQVVNVGEALANEPSPLFEKAHRFYYLVPWRKGGNNRMYVNDRSGTTLGWTDMTTGAIEMQCGGEDEPFVKTLLAAADPTGIKVAPGEVPKVPTQLFGGRLLSRFARLHTSLLVGQEWKKPGVHRLYGTLIDPAVTAFDLGWVDLKSGELHPSMDGPLHKDRREPAQYLKFLLHCRPDRRS
ncbi:MAG: NERD domain-containing protein [Acidimicrobiales bacterium]|nr:NERD domain-containing protein [Acidimicrobiales bacterium]